MASKLTISYDKEEDILEIALDSIRPAIAKELIPDLFVRYDLATFDEERNEGREIVGFTIANLSLWKAGDFRRLDRILHGSILQDVLQWAHTHLVGKSLDIEFGSVSCP